MHHSPRPLRNLISLTYACAKNKNETWYGAVLDDLRWLATKHPMLASFGDPSANHQAWSDFVHKCSRASWAQAINEAVAKSPYDPIARDPGVICVPAHCPICNQSMPLQAIGGHLSVVHNWRNPARAFACDSRCRACLRDFNTRPNLLKHLSYNAPQCLTLLIEKYPPLSKDEIETLDKLDLVEIKILKKHGRSSTYTGKLITQLSGPLLSSRSP